MTKKKQKKMTDDTTELAQDGIDFSIVPNINNKFLRLEVLRKQSPAFGHIIEIVSVETEEVKDYLYLHLTFNVLNKETMEIIDGMYENLPSEMQAKFIKDVGDCFTAIVTTAAEGILKEASNGN